MEKEEVYIGPYKVIRFFKSGRREILERGLTREEAIRTSKRYSSTNSSFVGFDKQFTSSKYFKTV